MEYFVNVEEALEPRHPRRAYSCSDWTDASYSKSVAVSRRATSDRSSNQSSSWIQRSQLAQGAIGNGLGL